MKQQRNKLLLDQVVTGAHTVNASDNVKLHMEKVLLEYSAFYTFKLP